ncbi:amino acid transport GAP1 [Apiospora aurea]|uniref:Amino acid transport GAP1 n=1 Tax=Apiospora aurea TaxID=335848 RepID=A0ABR1Q333_9PEZI
MASSQHVSELLRSLKKLFDSGVYTDLKIVCGNDQHQVHKAIVCLRSGRLAQLCSEIGPNQEATITIPDDDPQTIDLMLQYLYTLEYSPRIVAPTAAVPKPPANGINGVNGHHHKDDATPSPKTLTTNGGWLPGSPAYNIEREAFEAVPATESASKPSKKAAKKKKRSGTLTADALEAISPTATAPTVAAAAAAAAAPPEPASATKPAAPSTTANAAAHTVPPTAIPKDPLTPPPPPQHALLQHAKLYTLARKYGVPGLRALSAARFAAEAEEYWSSDDFLAAAVEAYNNSSANATTANPTSAATTTPNPLTAKQTAGVVAAVAASEEENEAGDDNKPKTIRDVVLGSMKAHPELLDRAAVREAIRVNAELSFDLMMFFRDNQQQNGGSASSVVSMQSGVGTTRFGTQSLLTYERQVCTYRTVNKTNE